MPGPAPAHNPDIRPSRYNMGAPGLPKSDIPFAGSYTYNSTILGDCVTHTTTRDVPFVKLFEKCISIDPTLIYILHPKSGNEKLQPQGNRSSLGKFDGCGSWLGIARIK